MKQRYYFTYGLYGNRFHGGWSVVELESNVSSLVSDDFARLVFMKHYGEDNPSVAYSRMYCEEEFVRTSMYTNGNFGKKCHEVISVSVNASEGNNNNDVPSPVTVNKELANIVEVYQQEIGVASPAVMDMCKEWLETYGANMTIEAIKMAAERNARNARYINAVLRGWKSQGFTTREQAFSAIKSQRREMSAGTTHFDTRTGVLTSVRQNGEVTTWNTLGRKGSQ